MPSSCGQLSNSAYYYPLLEKEYGVVVGGDGAKKAADIGLFGALLSLENQQQQQQQHKRGSTLRWQSLRGGRKKLPLYPEDYSDNDYTGWWDKVELEEKLMRENGAYIDDVTPAQMEADRIAKAQRDQESEEENRLIKEQYDEDSEEPFPSYLNVDDDPDIRPYYLPEEIEQDKDGWTKDMWVAFEYGLRKFGTRWTNILRSKKGRYSLRFLDQTDLLKKWRIEKAKNSSWGKWPNFYYYKGAQGKKLKLQQQQKSSNTSTSKKSYDDDNLPQSFFGDVLFKNSHYERKKKTQVGLPAPPPSSGYHNVFWSHAREGWFGMFKYWSGGGCTGPLRRGGGASTRGRVTIERTGLYPTPKEAHQALLKKKEEWGLSAAEEFEEKVESLGLQSERIAGKDRVKLYKFMLRAGMLNRTVQEDWLITPLPIRIHKAAFYNQQRRRR